MSTVENVYRGQLRRQSVLSAVIKSMRSLVVQSRKELPALHGDCLNWRHCGVIRQHEYATSKRLAQRRRTTERRTTTTTTTSRRRIAALYNHQRPPIRLWRATASRRPSVGILDRILVDTTPAQRRRVSLRFLITTRTYDVRQSYDVRQNRTTYDGDRAT